MIRLENLYKSFNQHTVLQGLSLEIPSGEITVILGPSGIGKSVLLKIMIGLIKPDSGRVLIDGTDITQLDPHQLNEIRRKFGMLFQNAALFDSLSVEENVAFPLKEHTNKSHQEIHRIVMDKLQLVGLEEAVNKHPAELSGGMRKRVGLARAIALEPEIILYDEPTTGLDPLTCETINDLIVTMQKKLHITSVIISHDIESTFQVAHQVAMIHKGRIIESGTPEVFRKSHNDFVRHFIGSATP